MLPAKMVPGAVEECATNGVRCATIFSGGFAEAGDTGRKLQFAALEAAQRCGMRLLGPNCLGVINANDKVALSANEVLEAPQLVGGRISLLSQSGSLLGSLLSRAQDHPRRPPVFGNGPPRVRGRQAPDRVLAGTERRRQPTRRIAYRCDRRQQCGHRCIPSRQRRHPR
jgi:hypothetical protein